MTFILQVYFTFLSIIENTPPQLSGKCDCFYHNKKYIEYQDHFSKLIEDDKDKIVEQSNYLLRDTDLPVSFDLLNESLEEDKEIIKEQMLYDESMGNQIFIYFHLNNNKYYLFHPIGGFNEYLGCNELVTNNIPFSKDYEPFSTEIYCDTTVLNINHFTDMTKGIILNTRCHLFHFIVVDDGNNNINIKLLHKFEIMGCINCLSVSPIFQCEAIYLNNKNIYKYNGNDLPKQVVDLNKIIHSSSVEDSQRIIISYNNEINTYLISVDRILYLYNENTNEINILCTFLDVINGIYNSIMNPFHLIILTNDKIHYFDKRNMSCEMNVIKYFYQLPLTQIYSYITVDNEENIFFYIYKL